MPRPAVIQLIAPGRIGCSEPTLSRCTISPSNRYVTVARLMCGCGRTSMPFPGASCAGPMWSKKTNGPTLLRAAGSSRSTLKPPMSRLRPAMIRSIAAVAVRGCESGSLALRQLKTACSCRWRPLCAGAGRAFPGSVRLDGDLARLRVLGLLDVGLEHALLELGRELAGVELFRQAEDTAEAWHSHFGVSCFHPLRHFEVHLALDRQRLAIDLQVEAFLRNPGQVGVEGDSVHVLDHVDRRKERRQFASLCFVHRFLLAYWMVTRRG